jgi:hypothetical protein
MNNERNLKGNVRRLYEVGTAVVVALLMMEDVVTERGLVPPTVENRK